MIKCIKSLFSKNEFDNKLNEERKRYILYLLSEARAKDKSFDEFGSNKHRYNLNPVISADKVLEAEIKYQFRLPKDYFWFITSIGNGGAGPYYGLEPFKIDDENYLVSLGKNSDLSYIDSDKELVEKYRNTNLDEYDGLFLDWYETWLKDIIDNQK